MYESTRNLSENAVKAGQAYDNILSAIHEAMNSSEEALIDSEIAHNEVFIVKFQTFPWNRMSECQFLPKLR